MPQPKKNQTYTFLVQLEDSSNPGVFRNNPTIAAGDVKVSTDGSARTNLANLPTVENGIDVKPIMSAGEMNGDRVVVEFKDQTVPPEWEPIVVNIYPEVNTLADIAAKTNKLNFDGADSVKSVQQYATGLVVADGANATNSFKTNLASGVDDFYAKGQWIRFTTGTLAGQIGRPQSYNGTTKFLNFSAGFSGVPAAGDIFEILNQ